LSRILFRSDVPVTLVGGGPVGEAELAAALALAPRVLAADSGAEHRLPPGHRLEAVFGDMDSLRDPGGLRAGGTAVHVIEEQESTDLEKCLYSIAAPLVLGVGFLGGRADHTLASMNALVRHPPGRLVLVGAEDLCFHSPPAFQLDLPAGVRVSLFPMRAVNGLGSRGLRWPLDGLAFRPDGRIGTSNAATGGTASWRLDGEGMLALLPLRWLAPVAAALAAPAR
jgi:thiamine pyrophosphokinase